MLTALFSKRVTWVTLAFLALGVLRFLFGNGVLG